MKILLALPLMLTLAACGGETKGDAKKDPKAADAKPGDAKPGDAKPADAPKVAGPLDLPKLGLKGDAPEGTEVKDAIGGGAGHMLMGSGGFAASVEVASDTRPKTADDAKKEADMYTPKNLKDEKLADGWAITFDNEGGMGKNFFVNVRREIDGKSIWCETTSSTPEQAATVLAFCKSLKK